MTTTNIARGPRGSFQGGGRGDLTGQKWLRQDDDRQRRDQGIRATRNILAGDGPVAVVTVSGVAYAIPRVVYDHLTGAGRMSIRANRSQAMQTAEPEPGPSIYDVARYFDLGLSDAARLQVEAGRIYVRGRAPGTAGSAAGGSRGWARADQAGGSLSDPIGAVLDPEITSGSASSRWQQATSRHRRLGH